MGFMIHQTIDLTRENMPLRYAQPLIAGDDSAHTWLVTVMYGGSPANLAGMRAACFVRRAGADPKDETEPALELAAAISGNTASAVFSPEVYALSGSLVGVMRLQDAAGRIVSSAVIEMTARNLLGNRSAMVGTAVLYSAQELTDAQQAQARENIGAAEDGALTVVELTDENPMIDLTAYPSGLYLFKAVYEPDPVLGMYLIISRPEGGGWVMARNSLFAIVISTESSGGNKEYVWVDPSKNTRMIASYTAETDTWESKSEYIGGNPLTLTGAVEATYNGSETVSVEIPEYIKTVELDSGSILISDYETGLYRFVTTRINGLFVVTGRKIVAGENKGTVLFHMQSSSNELIMQITKMNGYQYVGSELEATDTIIWCARILGSNVLGKVEYDPATDTYTPTKEYIGSAALTISIPNVEGDIYYTGERNETYALPRIPTPIAKTDEMTQPVGMDDSGLLYVAPQDSVVLASSTEGSAKRFRLTVNDSGAVSAVEVTEE